MYCYIMDKKEAKEILKKLYPLKPGDVVSFLISEALLAVDFKGSSYATEVKEFIVNL